MYKNIRAYKKYVVTKSLTKLKNNLITFIGSSNNIKQILTNVLSLRLKYLSYAQNEALFYKVL